MTAGQKSVLITGATSGIGESLVELYAQRNYRVIACGRNELKLAALKSNFPEIDVLQFDITDKDQIEDALAQIDSVDIVILNAGDCEYIDDVEHFDNALFERVINVNLISIGKMLPHIIPKVTKGGTLSLMGSSVTYLPFPRAQAYGASKAGVDYLAQSLRLELQPKGLNVSLIQPGFIKTPLTDKNDFDMPFLMTSEQAAQRIFDGIEKNNKLIRFPKRFIYLMKLMSFLPEKLWASMVLKGV